MSDTIIIGAGLAGLIAACKFPNATVYEAGPQGQQHKALLRFRDRSVSDLTCIPFKEVEVRKEIWSEGEAYKECTISLANKYSRKVTGSYLIRSIWNLSAAKRYVAPLDFYDQLVEKVGDRIAWATPIAKGDIRRVKHHKFINTSPLPVIMGVIGMSRIPFNFEKSGVHVDRYRLPYGTELYQTIYFPQSNLRVFRASITGDVLIVELLGGDSQDHFEWPMSRKEEFNLLLDAFGLRSIDGDIEAFDSIDQKYGKIIDLPRHEREAILYELTRDFNVFSVGRFATWRNILLDDVVKDLNVIERLMAASAYGRELVLASRS